MLVHFLSFSIKISFSVILAYYPPLPKQNQPQRPHISSCSIQKLILIWILSVPQVFGFQFFLWKPGKFDQNEGKLTTRSPKSIRLP